MERMATRGFGAMSQSCSSACNVEKLAVLSLMPYEIWSPWNLKMGHGVTKTLISNLQAHYFFNDCAADSRKHSAKMREPNILKTK